MTAKTAWGGLRLAAGKDPRSAFVIGHLMAPGHILPRQSAPDPARAGKTGRHPD